MIIFRLRRNRGFTLAEMIMAVAMLAFFSVFIVQMFAKAEQLSRQSESLDQAVICASEWADQWKRQNEAGVIPEILNLRNERQPGQSELIFLDSAFKLCQPSESAYTALLTINAADDDQAMVFTGSFDLWILSIEIRHDPSAGQKPVYTLQTGRYFAKAGGG